MTQRPTPQVDGARLKGFVLVVEDDPFVADALAMLLDVVGFDVVVAADADQARERLRERGGAPMLLLCDYRLRKGDGIEAIRSVREMFGSCVPTILITGDTSAALQLAVRRIDHVEYLRKPLDGDELLRRIEQLTNIHVG